MVAIQIGRRPRSVVDVRARCHLDLPVVIAVPPHLDDGTPFPTLYWLTCPAANRRIGRLEGAGGVRAAEERIATDADYATRFARATVRYAGERDALIDETIERPRPSGGIAGSTGGVKCLHAHYADHAAGNDNPVGEEASLGVEPLDCVVACVIESNGQHVTNPKWWEPKH